MPDANRAKPGSDLSTDPAPRLFGNDGYVELGPESLEGLEAAAEVPIAFGLNQLHGRVHVHAESVSPDIGQHLSDCLGGEITRLHDTNVAEEKGIRRVRAHLVRPTRLRALLHRALTSQPECVTELVCDRG